MVGERGIVIKKVEDKVKEHIVKEIESGRMSQKEVAREYGFSLTVIKKWLEQYGKLRMRTKIVEFVMKDEKEKIKELQRALGDAHLKIRFYETLVERASKESGVDIKKKFGTKASDSLSGEGSKSKDSAE